MSGQMDVLACAVERLRAPHPDHAQDAANNEAAIALHEFRAAVAELIEQMRDVLELWDSNSMSIDGKAATMQCRPEKWRAALARVGGAK